MKLFIYIIMTSILLGFTSASFASEDAFRIVVNPANNISTIDKKLLAEIFLKKKTQWEDGSTIVVVDMAPTSVVRFEFSEKILGRSVAAVRNYWQQVLFSGKGVPPVELNDDQLIVNYVSSNEGAIGYVSVSAEVGRLKVLTVR